MTNCEVITKADIGSDHRLVRMTQKVSKTKNHKKSKNLLILTHTKSEA